MEARSVVKYLRISPRKLRLVADLVRGVPVEQALKVLEFTPKRGARMIAKALRSAVANAESASARLDVDSLRVAVIRVDGGPTLKRFLPRAHGRATPIRKRTSHLTIVVSDQPVSR
ncbi:MAG: 50S ribosomal protein L22 [Candidatus Binatia bacterium]|nr:MAG: 50S ribosomal protein L22 [Candidatus Binatia bacterium]